MSVRLAAVVVALAACTTSSPSDGLLPPPGREGEPSSDSSGTDTAPPAATPGDGGGNSLPDDGKSPKVDAGSDAGSTTDPYLSARYTCVYAVNHFRGLIGLGPLERYPAKEACADAQVTVDAAQSSAHYAYLHGAPNCLENNVLDRQNECPGWYGPPAQTAADCVARMYAEGPGTGVEHGHYTTMMNAQYTRLSCGFRVVPGAPPGSEVWVVLNFY